MTHKRLNVTAVENQDNDDCKEVEMVPPEGGWGYVICLGLATMFVICTAHQPTIGMIYNDFLNEIGEGTSGLSLVIGVFGMSTSCAGFVTNIMLKRYSLRQVGMLGATIYFLGTLIAVFVRSISHMVFANGILQGLGFGVMIPVCYTSFNMYFTQKRVLLLSLCKTCIGIMSMVYPFILERTMDIYGFRGTLLTICAISAHIFIAMIVIQPVEWHMKRKVKEPVKETIKVIVTSDSDPNITSSGELENGGRLISIKESIEGKQQDCETDEPLICNSDNESLKVDENKLHTNSRPATPTMVCKQLRSNSVTLSIRIQEYPRRYSYNLMQEELEKLAYEDTVHRAKSISSLSNMGNVPIEPMQSTQKGKAKWREVVDMMDFGLFKDPIYVNIVIGTGLGFFTDVAFFILQPLYLYRLGFTNAEVAKIIAAGATTDLIARLIMALVGKLVSLKGRTIFLFGAVTCALFRTVFLFFTDFWGATILTAIMGLFRCCVQIPLAVIIAEHVPIERFASAYGLFMFICGFINLILGPGIGLLRDLSDSYIVAFMALNLFNLVCIIPWTIEFIYSNRKSKNKLKSSY